MARRIRSSSIETRTQRLRLPVHKKPVFVTIAPGLAVGYRRGKTSGTWVMRAADGAGSNWTKRLAIADDYEPANSESVLDFWQAANKARALARGDGEDSSIRPVSVSEALDQYESALTANGGDVGNATRVRNHLPRGLSSKAVALLNARELRSWRDGLIKKGMTAPSADRTARILKAALNLAASDDQKITNAGAWKAGLKRLPDSERARNVVLGENQIRDLVAAVYALDADYGLLVELLATTGARVSQLRRLTAADIQDKGPAPRLMVPSSKKGRRRRSERKPLPIPVALAKALRRLAAGKSADEPLFSNCPVSRDRRVFDRARSAAGLGDDVTPYSLRHSSITRMLLAGTPTRVVAAVHDTSVVMLERTYSSRIADPSETLVRRVQLDLAAPTVGNVLPMPGKR